MSVFWEIVLGLVLGFAVGWLIRQLLSPSALNRYVTRCGVFIGEHRSGLIWITVSSVSFWLAAVFVMTAGSGG